MNSIGSRPARLRECRTCVGNRGLGGGIGDRARRPPSSRVVGDSCRARYDSETAQTPVEHRDRLESSFQSLIIVLDEDRARVGDWVQASRPPPSIMSSLSVQVSPCIAPSTAVQSTSPMHESTTMQQLTGEPAASRCQPALQ